MKPNNTRQQMTENIGLWGASLWSDCKLQINVFLYYCYLNKNIKWVISEFPYAIYFNTSICTKPFAWKWLRFARKWTCNGKHFHKKGFALKLISTEAKDNSGMACYSCSNELSLTTQLKERKALFVGGSTEFEEKFCIMIIQNCPVKPESQTKNQL